MIYPTLYKNKKRFWQININKKNDITINYGQIGNKHQKTVISFKQERYRGTGLVKAAYVSRYAQSRFDKKIKEGYSEIFNNIDNLPRPMLAQSYHKVSNHIPFPAYWQPKLDGVRCLAYKKNNKVILLSREGKEFSGLNHIRRELKSFLHKGEVFDGELFNRDLGFQELVSLVKKDQENSYKVQYHIYDCIDKKKNFLQRMIYIKDRFLCSYFKYIRTVYTGIVIDKKYVERIHDNAVMDGYEGIMLRILPCYYKQDFRSRDLLKFKKFKDEEFEIIDAYENIGRQAGQCTFVCKTKDGATFHCKPKGSVKQRKEYWNNFEDKYLGKKLTVRFFSYTNSINPVPRFPVGISIRDYE